MLRQVFVLKGDDIIYQRLYGNALTKSDAENFRFKIRQEAKRVQEKDTGFFDYFKYRVAYKIDLDKDLIFMFTTGLMDDFFRIIQPALLSFSDEFFKLFPEGIKDKKSDPAFFKPLDEIVDSLQNEIKPKISIVGFSGVGKTTIKNLIKKDEIPLQHIPTISGDIASVKIDKLMFSLFDFAGQEQFIYLWKGFIKGSNAVLVITDSTPINVEKSRFFIDLRNEEAPYARIAVIGNKQDLKNAMKVENVENILGLKTYPMIANKRESRDNMIQIISDILDLNVDESLLLTGLPKKETTPIVKEEKVSESLSKEVPLENLYSVNLDTDLLEEVIKDIKGVQIENILRNHLNMINTTIKVLNNDEELRFEQFRDYYNGYSKKLFTCRNVSLKQFLETQFSILQKNIEEDEFMATKLKDDKDIIINALLCAYLSEANPHIYPIFENITQSFKFKGYDDQTIKEIQAYYLRIVNKIAK